MTHYDGVRIPILAYSGNPGNITDQIMAPLNMFSQVLFNKDDRIITPTGRKNILYTWLAPTDSYEACGYSDDYYYVGINAFTPGSDITIDRIAWALAPVGSGAGSLWSKTIYSQIWTKNGNDLDTMQYESSVDAGGFTDTGAYPVYINFPFNSADLSNGVTYSLVVTLKDTDASGYVRVYRGTGAHATLGGSARWNSSKTRTGTRTYTNCMRIFGS